MDWKFARPGLVGIYLKICGIFLFMLFLIPTGYGQTLKKFSSDTASFPQELRTYMGPNLNEKDQAILEAFITAYQNGTFSPEEQTGISEICNFLKSRKARGVPYFTTYMEAANLFKRKNIASDQYLAWEQALADLIMTRKTPLRYILRFLQISRDFLTDFTLFKGRAVTWKVDSTNFSMVYQNDFEINLEKTTIRGYAQRDSVVITNARGVYIPSAVRWIGKSGHVTWERAGYPAEEVWADLANYTIEMTQSTYQADSVLFMNSTYFEQPVRGVLRDKIMKISQPERAIYPQFDSYEQIYRINGIQEGINYLGGLSMAGAVVRGTGSVRNPATLTFYRADTLQLIIRAQAFSFRKDRFSAANCSMTFMLDKDSIYHPNTAFTYNLSTREVSFYQTDNLLTHAPFYDTYHRINASVKSLTWKMDEPRARLTRLRGTTIGEARIWSTNFFNQRHFYSMQGLDELNPLQTVKKFTEWYYRDEFPVNELAKWMGMPEHTARRLLVNLALEGFIYYNPETGEAKVKQELYDYLDAFAGKIDYDVMMFQSKTRAPVDNAILNLYNKELVINGVPTIFLSDSQNVAIYPQGNRIRMSKNRSFSFNGTIKAGFAVYSGKNFFFNYDSFKIEMHNIDSLRLWAYGDKKDDLGRPIPEQIDNIVEVITGDLFIDEPNNKSGLKRYSEYPFFRSTEESYVYYQETSVYDSVYTRDKFRFVIHPFTLSNLDELKKEDLHFSGEFISGGIFPGIPQKLIVQEDNSLGFTTDAPPEGFPVYDGKGRFYNTVQMSNQGLVGSGKLDFQTSTFRSDKYIFFPDSMIAVAHDFQTQAQTADVRFPEVSGKDADLRWFPESDKFIVNRRTEDFQLYGNRTRLQGNLEISTQGMSAEGTQILTDGRIRSNRFSLTDHTFSADTADFTITAEGDGAARMHAYGVNVFADIDAQSAIFRRLVDTTFLVFPENQYISSLDRLTWDMQRKLLGIRNTRIDDDPYLLDKNPALLGSMWQVPPTFISTNPKTDTLGFASDTALYELATHRLNAYHVDFLEVADALIYPDQGEVHVERTGNLAKLENSRLLANGIYTLDSVQLNIFGRKDFYGSGTYTYTMVDGTEEPIFFTNVTVDDSLHTHAETEIPDTRKFFLSPAFEYRGKVELFAAKSFLTFDGGTRILHNCNKISRNWLRFTAEIDPAHVLIPVPEQPVSDNNVKIFNGHFITTDSTHIYPAFLSRRFNYSDIPVTTASGFLDFDPSAGAYRIGSLEKLDDTTAAGNLLVLDRNYCTLTGTGEVKPGVDLGQVKLISTGTVRHGFESDSVYLDLTLGIDFFLHPEALQRMSAKVDSLTNLEAVDIRDPGYNQRLKELIPPEAINKMSQETNLFGPVAELPREIQHTLFLTDVHFVWNTMTSSYQSVGKIGVGNINGKPINVYAEGYIEIQKKRSGDLMDIYLKFDENNWYYFGYTRGVMQVLSSDRLMLDIFRDLPPNKRKLNVARNETPYTYMVGVDLKLSRFLRRMEMRFEQPVQEEESR